MPCFIVTNSFQRVLDFRILEFLFSQKQHCVLLIVIISKYSLSKIKFRKYIKMLLIPDFKTQTHTKRLVLILMISGMNTFISKQLPSRGALVAQLVKCLTLDLGLGHDLRIMRLVSHQAPHSVWSPLATHSPSLSQKKKKINKCLLQLDFTNYLIDHIIKANPEVTSVAMYSYSWQKHSF